MTTSPTEIIASVYQHGGEVRAHNLQLQIRGFDQLPTRLRNEIQANRNVVVCALGTDGCPLATSGDIADLRCWLADGTLAWAGRQGLVIVPGCWEYGETGLVQMAGLYLGWDATGSTPDRTTFLRWARLITDRVRVMLAEDG